MKIIVTGTFENRLPGISGTSYPGHHHLDFSCQAWQELAGACGEASAPHKAANRGLRSAPPREKRSSSSGGKGLVNSACTFPPCHKHSQGPSFLLVLQASFLLLCPVKVSVPVLSSRAGFNPFLLFCPFVNLTHTSAVISDTVRRTSWSLQEPLLFTCCTAFAISPKRKLTSIINTFLYYFLCQCNTFYHLA